MKVTYITSEGKAHEVEAMSGSTMMHIALENNVPGIDADCGGECICATCHVFVESEWLERLSEPSDMEESLLDLNPDRQSNSRLSCQIVASDEITGIVLRVPNYQF